MNLAMVRSAERHRELIAHLAPERTKLGKAEMMGVRGSASADEAGLPRDVFQMFLIADALRLGECQNALVDRP